MALSQGKWMCGCVKLAVAAFIGPIGVVESGHQLVAIEAPDDGVEWTDSARDEVCWLICTGGVRGVKGDRARECSEARLQSRE